MLDQSILPFLHLDTSYYPSISVPAEEYRRKGSLFCTENQSFALRDTNVEKGNVISTNL